MIEQGNPEVSNDNLIVHNNEPSLDSLYDDDSSCESEYSEDNSGTSDSSFSENGESCDEQLCCQLLDFVKMGNINEVSTILRGNNILNIEYTSKVYNYKTALIFASNNVAMMDKLINVNANVNHYSETSEQTPLRVACNMNNPEACSLLISSRANVNFFPCEFSYLHEASQKGHLQIVQLLINAKANVNDVSFGKRTNPLHDAILNHHEEIAIALLAAGAKVNNIDAVTGNSPLLLSCEANLPDLVQLLITTYGADKDYRNKNKDFGETPLTLVIRKKYFKIITILVESGASLVKIGKGGYSPLMMACSDSAIEIKILKHMLNNRNSCTSSKFNLNHISGFHPHMTSLMIATLFSPEAVFELLAANANPNVITNPGEAGQMTALILACDSPNDNDNVIHALINSNADVNICSSNYSPLFYAKKWNKSNILTLLTDLNAILVLPKKKEGPLEKEATLFSGLTNIFKRSRFGRRWKTKYFSLNVSQKLLTHGKKILDLNGKFAQILEILKDSSVIFGIFNGRFERLESEGDGDSRLLILLSAVSETEARDWICVINSLNEI